jgi:tetratricopeptide (TPR) repeat protein
MSLDLIIRTLIAGSTFVSMSLADPVMLFQDNKAMPVSSATAAELNYRDLARIGNTLYKRGEYQMVIDLLGKHEFDQKNNDPYFYNNLGNAYVNSDEYKKGIRCLKKAVELQPRQWKHRYNLGVAYVLNEDLVSARYHIDICCTLTKDPKALEFKKWLDERVEHYEI